MIRTERLSKRYRLGKTEVPALQGIDLHVATGEFTAVSGPSGSGKTTLLNLIGCLDVPTSGDLFLDGQRIRYNGLARLHRLRLEKIGFIFQTFNLVPVLTAYENVEVPLWLFRSGREERHRRVSAALEAVGLADRHAHRPAQLSGGQQQRVAIARAIVADPGLVVADEPTGNLDGQSAEDVLDLLGRLNREFGKTVLMVTHDQRAVSLGTKVYQLDKGDLHPLEGAPS